MRVSELQDQQVVRMRLGRYAETGRCECQGKIEKCDLCGGSGLVTLTEPVWGDWAHRGLYVQRDNKGKVCTLTPLGVDWAEYDPRHGELAGDTLECEGYYMQIDGLTAD